MNRSMRAADFPSSVFSASVPSIAASSSRDAVYGPSMGALANSTSGMPGFGVALGTAVPFSATPTESSHAGMTARSSVMAQMPALTDANGEQVLNNNEGEFLFVLDGADTIRRDTSLGAVHVYTLAGVNDLLRKHALEESHYMRDVFDGSRAERLNRKREQRKFITTPADFAERIKFFGVQLSSTQTTQGANWHLQKKAGVTLFPTIAEGRSPVCNLWGTVTERSDVGFLVRAFPDVEIAGTQEALLQRAPLQVVPVIKTTGGGVRSTQSFGTPFVPRREFGSSNADSSSGSSRKRPRRTIDEFISECNILRHTMRGEFVPELKHAQTIALTERSSVMHASTISDSNDLERITSTYSIYGLEARDSRNPSSVNPEGMSSSYIDTVLKGFVSIGRDNRKAYCFAKERTQGVYIPVGFVQSAATGGMPNESSIRRAIYDVSGHGFAEHRSKHLVYLQIRT